MGGPLFVRVLDDRFDPQTLDQGSDLASGRYAAVVALFYLDPALRRRLEALLPCHGLDAVVGSEADWGEAAFQLASRWIAGGRWVGDPETGGEPWRAYLWEALYRELHRFRLVLGLAELARRLLRDAPECSEVVLEGSLDATDQALLEAVLEDDSRVLFRALEAEVRRGAPASDSGGRLTRLVARLREAWTTRTLGATLADLGEGLDPGFHHRCRWGPRLRWTGLLGAPPAPGSVVLLSAYRNNTSSLAAYAPLIEQAAKAPLHWLTLTASAARGLPTQARSRGAQSWLWAYQGDAASAQRDPLETRDSVLDPCAGEDPPGWRQWLETSPTVGSWLADQQHLARQLTACFEAFLDQTRPRLLVMANQFSIEGWLARLARRRGVPVVQVMHGVLGGHLYTRTPVVGDLLVTFGSFWRGLWPVQEQGKIAVADPGGRVLTVPRRAGTHGRRRLTFFSWDLEPLWGYAAADFRQRLAGIFHRLLATGTVEIRVRCHPLENPRQFLDDWQARFGPPPSTLRVEKGGPLEPVLAETDVALMFRSTLMLHCLASRIPVVMPGWIDFEFNAALDALPGVCLAADGEALERQLIAWLDDPPEVPEGVARPLAAPPGEGDDTLVERLRGLGGGGLK